jgi:hypothetical protein
MLKKTILFSALLLFGSIAVAEVQLVSPFEKFINETQVVEVGSAQAGETFELIFSNNSGSLKNWETVSAENLPEAWKAVQLEQPRNKNTLILRVSIPANSETGAFMLKTALKDSSGNSREASFLVFVQEGLLNSNVDSLKKTANSGEEITFLLSLNNDSIAEHTVSINSSLPLTWFKPETASVKQKSSKTIILKVNPKSYGEKKFTIFAKSALNGKTINEIKPTIEVKPTLKSKYEAAQYGFPFFTPSLIPYYIFNSFISQLS